MFGLTKAKDKRIELLEKLLTLEQERNKELLNRLLMRHDIQPIHDKQDIEKELEKMKISLFAEVDETGKEVKLNQDGSIR